MSYGCHNRPPLGEPRMVPGINKHGRDCYELVPHAMTRECQYTHSQAGRVDPQCEGCRWRAPDAAEEVQQALYRFLVWAQTSDAPEAVAMREDAERRARNVMIWGTSHPEAWPPPAGFLPDRLEDCP